jgi:hypothetical protein
MVKGIHATRKSAFIPRRAKELGIEQEFVHDDDALGYVDIYQLKKTKHEAEGTYDEKMKISVSDEDIKAFRSLEDEGQFYKDITLEKIAEKVAVTKGTAPEVTTEEEIPADE